MTLTRLLPRVLAAIAFMVVTAPCAAPQDLSQRDVADLFARASPSLVQIHVDAFTPSNGDQRASTSPQICSGFVIDAAAGVVVTATCDASKGEHVQAQVGSGQTSAATFVGRDDTSGVAVYRIASDHLTALPWANVAPRTGQQIALLGYAYGLGPLVSTGLISGQNIRVGEYPLRVMFVDTLMSRGMAGAPVTNLSGEVVGMVCAMYGTTTVAGRTYGAVLPADDVRRIVASILEAHHAR